MKKTKKRLLFAAMVSVIAVLGGCGNAGVERAVDTAPAPPTESSSPESAQEAKAESSSSGSMQETQKDDSESQKDKKSSDAKAEESYRKTPNPAASEGSRILFVGNSHTFTNDLPEMFSGLAEAGGHAVDVYDVTEGGYTLKQFSDPEDMYGAVVTAALQEQRWDFVVLQENTNAALPGNAETEMLPSARKLDEMIRAAGGQTVFLMTWSPEKGAGAFPREMVQSVLSDSYQAAAKELDALLIPGGDVFMEALRVEPELKLWGEDGQHPSPEGTYLAACTAYALLFQETPAGNAYHNEIDDGTAGRLQETAQSCVLGR